MAEIYYSQNGGLVWNNITSTPWYRRDYPLCVVDPQTDIVYLLGGLTYGGSPSLNDIWASSDGVVWIEITDAAPWAARFGATGTAVYSQALETTLIYIMSGVVEQYIQGVQSLGTNDIWVSSNLGISWTQLVAAAPFDIRTYARLTATSDGILILTEGAEDVAVSDSYYPHDIWVSADSPCSQPDIIT